MSELIKSQAQQEAQYIANRALCKQILESIIEEHGSDILRSIKRELSKRIKSKEPELVYDYFIGTDHDIQQTLDKYERWEASLAKVEEALKEYGHIEGKCQKEHGPNVDVHVVSASELVRRLFDL